MVVVRDNLIGNGRAWRQLLARVVEIARFTSSSLLLAGESGTGKELVARLVHTLDARAQKAELVIVDCTTIVPTPRSRSRTAARCSSTRSATCRCHCRRSCCA